MGRVCVYSISILGVDFGSECRPGVRWMRSEVEIAGEFLLFFFFFFFKGQFFLYCVWESCMYQEFREVTHRTVESYDLLTPPGSQEEIGERFKCEWTDPRTKD